MRKNVCFWVQFISIALILGFFNLVSGAEINRTPIDAPQVMRSISSMPLAFTENQGQWPDSILYRADAIGATIWFTCTGVYYEFIRQTGNYFPATKSDFDKPDSGISKDAATEVMMIKTSLSNISSGSAITGADKVEYVCNYYLGKDIAKWRSGVPNYSAIMVRDIYPGIDLKYYGNGHRMEYDFVVAPHADYSRIRIEYDGIKSLKVSESGELIVGTSWGEIIETLPNVYQDNNGTCKKIHGTYHVITENTVGFNLDEDYDPTVAVIIDPVLTFSTYLGGAGQDIGLAITTNASGRAWITGQTGSSDFPTSLIAYDKTINGTYDAFFTVLSASGNSLVYSTFIGGSASDNGSAIAIDNFQNVYIAGYTLSADFPTLNAYDNSYNGLGDGFVCRFNQSGFLLNSTYLGGSGKDTPHGLAVEGSSKIYIIGETQSNDFPTANAYDSTFGGVTGAYIDVFITKMNSGSSISYSTYLGGSGSSYLNIGMDIAVDDSGYAYITGNTSAPGFPVVDAIDSVINGGTDVFAAKLSPAGNSLIFSTFIGGSNGDYGTGIAIDSVHNSYICGYTKSADFPTFEAYDNSLNGTDNDAFVLKLSADGQALIYSTYLGGTGYDVARDIRINSAENSFLTGWTNSTDFPVINAYDGAYNGGTYDAFITKLSSSGKALYYSTYLGGSGADYGYGISADDSGNALVTGSTASTDFPLQNAYRTTYAALEAFVTKMRYQGLPDLRVRRFQISGSQPVAPGDDIGSRLSLVVENVGDTASPSSCQVGFYLSSDTTITDDDVILINGLNYIPAIPKDDSVLVSIGSKIIPEDYMALDSIFLGVIVDVADTLMEKLKINNFFSQRTFVICPVRVPRQPGYPRPADGQQGVDYNARLCWDSILVADFDDKTPDQAIDARGACWGEPAVVQSATATVKSNSWRPRCLQIDPLTDDDLVSFEIPDQKGYSSGIVCVSFDIYFPSWGRWIVDFPVGGYLSDLQILFESLYGGIKISYAGTQISFIRNSWQPNTSISIKARLDFNQDKADVWCGGNKILDQFALPSTHYVNKIGFLAASSGGTYYIDNVQIGPDRPGCPTKYDVLFGKANPPTELIGQDLTIPGCVQPDWRGVGGETFYWRVIAHSGSYTVNGPIWSYTSCMDLAQKNLTITDGAGSPIIIHPVSVSKVDYDIPTFTKHLIGLYLPDISGTINLASPIAPGENICLKAGDSIQVLSIIKDRNTNQRGNPVPLIYSIAIDNCSIINDGDVTFGTITAEPNQTIQLNHTTVLFDLLVTVQWDATPEYLALIDACLRHSSNFLYDVTDGQALIRNVEIYDERQHYGEGDIAIRADNTVWPHVPWNGLHGPFRDDLVSSIMGIGEVNMPIVSMGDKDANIEASIQLLPVLDSRFYKTILHESGHYIFGFLDEYLTCDGDELTHGDNYGMMEDEYREPRGSELSREKVEYLTSYGRDTKQWCKYEKSCWQQFHDEYEKSYDNGIFANIVTPDEGSGLDVAGPNKEPISDLDYDVGSQITTIVTNQHDDGAIDKIATVLDSDGEPAPYALVYLLEGLYEFSPYISLGRSNYLGQICLRGYHSEYIVATEEAFRFIHQKSLSDRAGQQYYWMSGEGQPFDSAGMWYLRQSSVIGEYPFIYSAVLGQSGLSFELYFKNQSPQIPQVDLFPDDTLLSSTALPLAVSGSKYVASISSNIGQSGYMITHAIDDSSKTFRITNTYSFQAIDDSLGSVTITSENGDVEFSLDSANIAGRSALILTSPYPPIRNGIPDTSYQAGNIVSLSIQSILQNQTLLNSNILALHYSESDFGDTIAANSNQRYLKMYGWDVDSLKWIVITGSKVDTSRKIVYAQINKTGIYGAFTDIPGQYKCGDADGSGAVNILDVSYEISYLYRGGPAPNPWQKADVDHSGAINILDVAYLVNYLYKGGPTPYCPPW